MKRSTYDHTLYYSLDERGESEFMLVTQVDDYQYTGSEKSMVEFEKYLKERLGVGTLTLSQLPLMGCVITRHKDGTVKLSQSEK